MTLVAPPPWHTSAIGSFAHDTLRVRVPDILARTRRKLPSPPAEVEAALDELAAELRHGRVRALREATPDRAFWDRAVQPHRGRGWLDLPWFFAEAYFYRRLLEATGYFGDGPLGGVDPFAADKACEWAPDEAPRRCAETLAAAPLEPRTRLRALLHASLWGNRADLSYDVARQLGAFAGDAATDLLVDDTPAIVQRVFDRPPSRVAVIADNAGTELAMDLALIDHLLDRCGVDQIALHLKAQPMFVSDAMPADLTQGLQALVGGQPPSARLAQTIQHWLREGRLTVKTHPFYTTSLFYPEMPADLGAELRTAALVIMKGDANYRRLCSDAPWPPETPFAAIVDSFPAPLLALRTLKSEVIAGLAPGVAERCAREDPRWLVNGKRGIAQARL